MSWLPTITEEWTTFFDVIVKLNGTFTNENVHNFYRTVLISDLSIEFVFPSTRQHTVLKQETAVEDVWFDHIIPAIFYFAPLCQLGTDWSANSANNAKTRGLGSKGCREALEALTQLCPVCESSLLYATQFRPFGFGFSESANAEESFEMVWVTFGSIFSHKHCELHRLKIPRDASTVPLTVQTSL